MKKNLYLDPDTNDITTVNFNLRLTKNLTEFVSQKLENRLKTFQGEWFVDRTIGLPYYQRILKKKADVDDINSLYRAEINSVEEVVEIIEFTPDYNEALRKYSLTFKAKIKDPDTDEIQEEPITVTI